jgi:hypothetical protein
MVSEDRLMLAPFLGRRAIELSLILEDRLMKRYFAAAACSLILMTGGAFAQTTSTTTTVTPPAMAPMPAVPGTVSTEHDMTTDSSGNQVDTKKTTYGDADGNSSESSTTTTATPPPATTTTTHSTTSSGY